jgi:hypothetical protein
MDLFEESIKGTLSRGLLVRAATDRDVLWTPSVAAKLNRGAAARRNEVALSHPDKIIGRYRDLRTLREKLQAQNPTLWIGTDIHHIVENQHLQFIGVRGAITEHTYNNEEPCVLLPQDHHRLLMHSLIGGSLKVHGDDRDDDDDRGISYIREYNEFKKKNPVVYHAAGAKRTAKAYHRADWVSGRPPGTRAHIGELLVDVYEFAYHQSTERPLDQIAVDLISALCL